MAKINVVSVISMLFMAYIAHSMWTLYSLFHPSLCSSTKVGDCLQPAYNPKSPQESQSLFELRLYLLSGERATVGNLEAKNEIFRQRRFNLTEEFAKTFEVDLPPKARRNGTVYLHAFLLPPLKNNDDNLAPENPFRAAWHLHQYCQMTVFATPQSEMIQLMSSVNSSTSDGEKLKKKSPSSGGKSTTNHWRSVITLTAIPEPIAFDWRQIPNDITPLIQLTTQNDQPQRKYLPIFYLDPLRFRVRDLVEITPGASKINLTLNFQPVGLGKLLLLITAQHSVENLKALGFTEKDVDEVKSVFTDTNFYFLALTFFVAAVHILLDFLAFKNDVNFWRQRKTMVGLSTRTVVWRCFSQFVIFLYLMDEETSLLVLIPAGVGALIELWKVAKAFKVTVSFRERRVVFGATSNEERRTDEFDSQGMKYLAVLMVPLCIVGAGYSLLYVPHKSWYSWFIQCTANGVYAFGFLFMLPQLFVNYKLKSVAHLPWRAFMYKAFNTFIDDLFAFIITMPTAHRVACFRDDVVFLVYLYQRWLYPVDKSRVNEFGESYEEEIDKKQEPKKTK